MEHREKDTFKGSQNTELGVSFDETVCFRATEAFKNELEEIADYYNRDTSDILREAVIRLVRQEAKARNGDEHDE